MNTELERRHSNTEKVYALLRAHFGRWVKIRTIARVGGFAAWRTRVSEARALCAADEELVWNEKPLDSAYMIRPKRLGPDAAMPRTQKRLF